MGGATTLEAAQRWTRKRLKLHGRQVGEWFASAGWIVEGGPAHDRHAFVDELVTPTVVARRLWHTPLQLQAVPVHSTTSRPATVAWLQVDGDIVVCNQPESSVTLAPASVLFHSSRPLLVQSTRPTARIEVSVPPFGVDARELPQIRNRTASSSLAALASVVSAIFNSDQEPDARTLSLHAHSIETLTEAMWFESSGVPFPPGKDLYMRGLKLISEHRSDPTFRVETLAQMLGVTRRHVSRVFHEHGMTPSRVIKSERLRAARRLMAANPTVPLETVASLNGFPSPRVLRESLRTPYEQHVVG